MCLLCLFSAGLEEVHVGGDGSYLNGNLVFTFEFIFPSFPTVCSKDLAESSLGDGVCVCTLGDGVPPLRGRWHPGPCCPRAGEGRAGAGSAAPVEQGPRGAGAAADLASAWPRVCLSGISHMTDGCVCSWLLPSPSIHPNSDHSMNSCKVSCTGI